MKDLKYKNDYEKEACTYCGWTEAIVEEELIKLADETRVHESCRAYHQLHPEWPDNQDQMTDGEIIREIREIMTPELIRLFMKTYSSTMSIRKRLGLS